ncbi:E3 ubiquitin-protein ligase RFI2-like isoform X1 [Salvia splendens]|uniref:E3 ubiquitin-protein ligase RFI2-like isoform X1 n=1 Tax=Salvia splendens TaxID=180675 RepID=UPI001C258799|nr:E3 ubiquitin-protein ligase RFI2-like isoform X1 [Salvia splendens]
MGLGDADLLDDGDGGGGGCKASAASVPCSICLDVVTDAGDRSWAKLQCGHQFHLDCIGSAFNIKGAMQCPNCRKIEKGQWLYANGGRQLPEFNMDDWLHDEDLHDLSYSEMSVGVHWCPYNGLTRLPSSSDEGEFSSSAYQDLVGHHAIFAEHAPMSSATHPCPYIAYVGTFHPPFSTSSGNTPDGSSFSNHWSGLSSAPSEVPNSYAFPSMDGNYHHNWEHPSHLAASNRIGSADQPPIPSLAQRTARSSDIPRPGMHPFIVGRSSASRAPGSITSSVLPPYPGPVARLRDRPPVQAYFQQSIGAPVARTSLVSTGRRSGGHRGLPQVSPVASSADGFYFFSSNPSGRSFQDAENPQHDHYYGWDREQQPGFTLNQLDRDAIWASFHPSSDSGVRPGNFRQRHGSERMPSQNRA